jgi:hypothetical protein
MREDEMEDAQDLDPSAEAAGRRLLTAAFDSTGADAAVPGDLLRRVRRQTSQRRRVRTLVPVGAVAALGGAAALVATTLTVAGAPSALAAVTAAAAKTSAQSFQVTETQSQTSTLGSADDGSPTRMSGVFDLGRGLGEEDMDGSASVRIVGEHIYVASSGLGFTRVLAHGKTWVEGLVPSSLALGGSTDLSQGFDGDEPINPGSLLGLLKSAASVTAEGAAAGAGWTGTKYAVTEQVPSGEKAPIIVHGTAFVDSQGRVRRLMTAQTRVIWSSEGVKGSATDHYDVTFGEFGVPVSVTAPPASQVYNLGQGHVFVNADGGVAVDTPRR